MKNVLILVALIVSGCNPMAKTDNGDGTYTLDFEVSELNDFLLEIDGCTPAGSGSGGGGGSSTPVCDDVPKSNITVVITSATDDFAGYEGTFTGTYFNPGQEATHEWMYNVQDLSCDWQILLDCDTDELFAAGHTRDGGTPVAATVELISSTADSITYKYTFTDPGGADGAPCWGTITARWEW